MTNTFKSITFAALASLGLAGCTPVGAAIGLGATVGVAAYQERGVEQAARDQKTELLIGASFVEHPSFLTNDLSIEVYENRVLLTGFAKTEQDRADAVRLAWENPAATEVINEIRVSEDNSVMDSAKDGWISTKLRALITTDDNIYAINYAIETSGGVVYLIGIAQSRDEIDRVVRHARGLSGVRKVVSHVRVKDLPQGS